MKITFASTSSSSSIDVPDEEPLETVLSILEATFDIPSARIRLVYNGKLLNIAPGSAFASSSGVKENDLVQVADVSEIRGGGGGSGTGGGGGGGHGRPPTAGANKRTKRSTLPPVPQIPVDMYPSLSWEDLPGGVTPDQLHAILKVNTGMMSMIERRDPQLATAAKEATVTALRTLLMNRSLDAALPEVTQRTRMAELERRLEANPMDIEAQAELEAEIQRKNIESNLEMAYEYMPESFGRVTMLYISASVNRTSVKAFIDSGAQSTIMSKKCAEKCGIMRLVDTKYAGTAVGVGSARIIGRVHMAELGINGHLFPCTFTVLDQDDMDFLFGLDMLRRYQGCIDLHKNVLRLRLGADEIQVPFLGEGELAREDFGQDGGSSSALSSSSSSSSATTAGGGSGSGGGAGGSSNTTSSGGGTLGAGGGVGGAGGNSSSSRSSVVIPPSSVAPPPLPPSSSSSSSSTTPSASSTSTGSSSSSSSSVPSSSHLDVPFGTLFDLSAFGGGSGGGRTRNARPGGTTASTRRDAPAATIPVIPVSPPASSSAASSSSTSSSSSSSSTPSATTAPTSSVFPDETITTLMSLGFSRAKVIIALEMASGNADTAAALLPDL